MLTLEELRRLHGEVAYQRVTTIKLFAGLQTQAEVLAEADQLIQELGEPIVNDREDPRRVVVAWPNRAVYARTCCPLIDLWRPCGDEVRKELEDGWVWGDPKRVVQLDADLDAEDPPLGESPSCVHPWHDNPGLITPCPECGEDPQEGEPAEAQQAPVEPVTGPGPYGPVEEGRKRVPPQEIPDYAEPFGSGEVLQPTEEQRELVASMADRANAALRHVLKGLLTLKPNPDASGKTCKHCEEEIFTGGVLADGDTQEWWHRNCAAERLVELGEPNPIPRDDASPGPVRQTVPALELNPVLIDRARGAYLGKPYKARHNPERLKKGEPIGDPACFACWRPIKRGDLAGRATKSSKKPMHWTCVEQVIERVGAAPAEEAA